MKLDLDSADTKLVLEALQALDERWEHICQTSSDEDEVADYGNDLISLRLLSTAVRKAALEAFGKGVLNFDRTSL
jgi:hypothetical protein